MTSSVTSPHSGSPLGMTDSYPFQNTTITGHESHKLLDVHEVFRSDQPLVGFVLLPGARYNGSTPVSGFSDGDRPWGIPEVAGGPDSGTMNWCGHER